MILSGVLWWFASAFVPALIGLLRVVVRIPFCSMEMAPMS